MNDSINSGIAIRIKEERLAKGWSQEQLGQEIGAHIGYCPPRQGISARERGLQQFDAVELWALSRIFRRPISYWFGEWAGKTSNPALEH